MSSSDPVAAPADNAASFDECGFRPADAPCLCGWDAAQDAAKRQDSALERLANLIIEHGLIIYHGDPDPFAAQKREAGAWQVPMRIYVGIPQFKQPTTANDLPLDADEVGA